MNRVPVVAGNWKMYKTTAEAVPFVKELVAKMSKLRRCEIIVAPSFVHLQAVGEAIKGSNIKLSAQNISEKDEGALTGEVSAPMLSDVGCSHVIIGHSERRQIFGETDETINKKLLKALEHNLKPILCVGETLDEREGGQTFQVVEKQLLNGLSGLDDAAFENILVAYEPVWAIGTGKTATPDQAQEVHERIRRLMREKYGPAVGSALRILYGGSVKPDNIAGLITLEDLDGALIGGACLEADSFTSIAFSVEEECANI
ncbi:triose-phosphate isomerase [Acidobacteriota bacterium]